jgi:hypothetical protein
MKIFLRIPAVDTVDREMTRWLVWYARQRPEDDIDIHVGPLGVPLNRDQICELFLLSDCTHLWMLDSDTIPPRSLSLLDHEVGCVNGIYQMFAPAGPRWDVMHKTPTGYAFRKKWPSEKIFPADAVGTGCMLLTRAMVEAIAQPRFEVTFNGSMLYPNGEDFTFCEKVIAAGEQVFVDPNYRCDHIKSVSLKLVEKMIR